MRGILDTVPHDLLAGWIEWIVDNGQWKSEDGGSGSGRDVVDRAGRNGVEPSVIDERVGEESVDRTDGSVAVLARLVTGIEAEDGLAWRRCEEL